jgi:hypothetical protein
MSLMNSCEFSQNFVKVISGIFRQSLWVAFKFKFQDSNKNTYGLNLVEDLPAENFKYVLFSLLNLYIIP